MTEPQPWTTTVQRRRESGATDVVPGSPGPEVPAADTPTPRHGQPADGPAAARVPSPFPRPRDPDASASSRETAQPHPAGAPVRQRQGRPRATHVRDVVEPHPERGRDAVSAPTVVSRDSRAMTALRVITYLLASLASLVFLALVVYLGIKAVQLRDTLSSSPFGSLTGSSSSPDAGDRPTICTIEPTAPFCAGG